MAMVSFSEKYSKSYASMEAVEKAVSAFEKKYGYEAGTLRYVVTVGKDEGRLIPAFIASSFKNNSFMVAVDNKFAVIG